MHDPHTCSFVRSRICTTYTPMEKYGQCELIQGQGKQQCNATMCSSGSIRTHWAYNLTGAAGKGRKGMNNSRSLIPCRQIPTHHSLYIHLDYLRILCNHLLLSDSENIHSDTLGYVYNTLIRKNQSPVQNLLNWN